MEHQALGTWNYGLVALSYVVAAFGSYVALENVRIYRNREQAGAGWLWTGALAMGAGGIWSMHFIGMLALNMKMPVSYEPIKTAASMLLAIAVTGLAFGLVRTADFGMGRLLAGGVLMGLGVASMHYLGMAAMRMPATIEYDTTLVTVSVVIAVVAATAALWLAFRVERAVQMAAAALVMGAAVCAMHYTGMAAASFTMMSEASTQPATGLGSTTLAFIIFVVISAVLVLMLRKALHEIEVQPT